MRGNLFIHSNTPALIIYLMVLLTTSYYSTNCIKDKLQKKKAVVLYQHLNLKLFMGFKRVKGYFLNIRITNTVSSYHLRKRFIYHFI